jgi:CHAT domain-containing protein
MSRAYRHPLLLPALLALLSPGSAAGDPKPGETAGIVVETVPRGSPGEKAGLRAEDAIVAWCRTPPGADPPCSAPRALDSPFAFAELETEQIQRTGLRLLGWRQGERKTWDLSSEPPQLTVRPALRGELLELHRAARDSAATGRPEAAVTGWRAAAAGAGDTGNTGETGNTGDMELAAWFLAQAARALAEGGRGRAADALYGEAIARAEQGGRQEAAIQLLLDRGAHAAGRGDLAQAEDCFRRAETRLAETHPESLLHGTALHWRAIVAMKFGELDRAASFLRSSLALCERLDPGGLSVAATFHDLGILEMARGDDPAAVRDLERGLALYEERTPGSLAVAKALSELAKPARRRRDFATAEGYYRRALAIREAAGRETLQVVNSWINLGILAAERGRLAEAASSLRRALALVERIAPESPTAALTLLNLGDVRRQQGLLKPAADLACRAEELVARRRRTLGGTDLGRAWSGVITHAYYHECLRGRVHAGQATEAFHILEQGRARAFLEQLAQRDLDLAMPEAVAGRRRALDAEYDATQARLAGERDPAESEHLRGRLEELYVEQQELTAQAREVAAGPAAGRVPEPIDLAAARRALDPGTVLLAYSVGDERTILFVVSPAGPRRDLSTFEITVGEKALRSAVHAFRALLQDASSDRRALVAQGRKLYDLLLRPAERQIARASRLLVSPDRPLDTLPFTALVHDRTFLAEWKPVHSVLSATVYRELRKARHPLRPPDEGELLAFGNPLYPQPVEGRGATPAPGDNPEVASAVRRGLSLAPLPESRREVLDIAALFPRSRVFLGAEATEERVKALAPRARFLHLACHGLLDERLPLNSALVLSLPAHPAPGQDNGLLQAWEI